MVLTLLLTCARVNTHHSVRIHIIYCGRWHWEDFASAANLHIRNGNVDAASRATRPKGGFSVLLRTLGFEKQITRFKS